jgi:hypothetical protein
MPLFFDKLRGNLLREDDAQDYRVGRPLARVK